MLIEIDKIGPKGLMLDDVMALEEGMLIEEESFFNEDIAYKIQLSCEQDKIRARGSITTNVSMRCVSCLDYYEMPIQSRFDLIMFPFDLIDDVSSGLSRDEMEYIFFDGEKIDLKKILMEQVNLFAPVRPVCSPDCKGLCSYCGANNNHESCQCKNSTKEISFLFNKLKR